MHIVPPVMMINTRDSGRLASGFPPSKKSCPISPSWSCWIASFFYPFCLLLCSVCFTSKNTFSYGIFWIFHRELLSNGVFLRTMLAGPSR